MEKGQGQGNFTLCTVQGSLNSRVIGFQHLKQNPHSAIVPSISVDLRKQPLAKLQRSVGTLSTARYTPRLER